MKALGYFDMFMVMWGLIEVTCGLSIQVNVMGHGVCGLNFPPHYPLAFVFASSSLFYAGSCTAAFPFLRSRVSMVAVLLTSVLSIIFGAILPTVAYSASQVRTAGDVVGVCSLLNVVFLFIFLFECCNSASGVLNEEGTENPPPPYDQATLERSSLETQQASRRPPINSQYAIEEGSHQATSLPPIYTIADWTRFQNEDSPPAYCDF